MERREFVRLGFLAAIGAVSGIEFVHSHTIPNVPHPSSVFTEEALRKEYLTATECLRREDEMRRLWKQRMHHAHYSLTHEEYKKIFVESWRGLEGVPN